MSAQQPPNDAYGIEEGRAVTHKDFTRLAELIHDHCGTRMPPVQKVMLESRLRDRLRELRSGRRHVRWFGG